jgi:sulfatase maturation enzyme AslB (radical SAM superfamily)
MIPLFQPWLEVTTVSNCTIDCKYCPQRIFQKHYHGCKMLTLSAFKSALVSVPRYVGIHFSGFAEPFLNPQCIDMMEYAHSKGYKISLFSTLVGLRSIDVERLRRCNPEVTLHLPDNLGNAKIPLTQTYKDTLTAVMKQLRITTFYVMNERFISNERAGSCADTQRRHLHGWFFCEKLSAPQFVMLPNCDVTLCCMDFGLKHIVGNLAAQSWFDIIWSPEYQKVCANRLKIDGDVLCRKCAWASVNFRTKYYIKRVVQRYYVKQCIEQYYKK